GLVIERGGLGGRVGGGVPERGENPIGAEAAALDADGADAQRGGQVTVLGARRRARAQFDERITGAQPRDEGVRERGRAATGADDPVPVAVRRRERVEERVTAEAAVEDDDRGLRQRGPDLRRQGDFTGAVGAEGRGGEDVGAQREAHYEAELRVAGDLALATRRAAEVRDILGRVCDAERGAIEAVDGEPAPAIRRGGGERPRLRGLREQG